MSGVILANQGVCYDGDEAQGINSKSIGNCREPEGIHVS